MCKKLVSVFLTFLLFCGMLPTTIQAAEVPEIYKDSVSIRVGNLTKVGFTYGDSATKATVTITNPDIEAYIVNETLYIKGFRETSAYVTLNFDDGSSDDIHVTVTDKYSSVNDENEIEIERGETKSIYIDLNVYDADKATITYDSDYVTVNKASFTSSGYLKVSGKYEGESTLRIKYNTGDAEVYDIIVVDEYSDSDSQEDIEIKRGEVYNYYLDLNDYNADEATITYDSDYVSVSKTTFYNNGTLKIEGLKEGSTRVRIKYDSGYNEYLNIDVSEKNSSNTKSYVSVDEIELEEGQSKYFYVYLGDNADEATLTLINNYATLSTNVVYKDSRIKITGNIDGETTLKVKFDDGTRVNIPVSVNEENYIEPTAEMSKTLLLKGEIGVLELFMGSENSRATITVEEPEKVKLKVSDYSKTKTQYTIYSSKNKTVDIEVEALDYVDDTYITVKYPEGKTYKIILSVSEKKVYKTDGFDKTGANFILKEGLQPNNVVLNTGYIAGYTDGTFGPLNNITRQEFGVILARIVNFNGDIKSEDFIFDVKADWSRDSIAKLSAMGAIRNDAAFRPNDYITRYEVAEMLYNILDLSSYSITCPLTDVGNTLLDKKISKCWNAGILAGYEDGTFKGDRNITRAEAVVLVNRIFYANSSTYKTNTFPDVSPNYWAYNHILKASKE